MEAKNDDIIRIIIDGQLTFGELELTPEQVEALGGKTNIKDWIATFNDGVVFLAKRFKRQLECVTPDQNYNISALKDNLAYLKAHPLIGSKDEFKQYAKTQAQAIINSLGFLKKQGKPVCYDGWMNMDMVAELADARVKRLLIPQTEAHLKSINVLH